ncbi:MAG: hypothetical protein ACYCY9_05630 [Thiobacillus sp.]
MMTNGSGNVAARALLFALGAATGVDRQAQAASSGTDLSEADRAAVFRAAGAVQHKGMWLICADDPNPGGATIESVRDLNGDGRPEAVVTEGGIYCYGHAGTGFQLLSKQADGSWRVMTRDSGIPEFLKTRGTGGWPDISVGGPGFCFPVERWNGKAYKLNRFEYEGKRCKPPR